MMYGVIGLVVGFIAGYCFRILREAQAGEIVHVHPEDVKEIPQPMMEDVENDEPPVTYVPMQPVFTKKKKIALFVLMVIIFFMSVCLGLPLQLAAMVKLSCETTY